MTDLLARGSLDTSTSTTSAPARLITPHPQAETAPDATQHTPTPLRVRGPAHAVMTECLRIQSTARRQPRLATLFGRSPLTPDARSWYRAALGELQVARMLKSLPEGWTVLHSADTADLLVIGPAGVFTISTRNHSGQRVWVGNGTLLVNGHRTHHLTDARHEASRTTRHLNSGVGDPTDVTPVIAVVDPGSLVIKGRSDVLVLASSQLTRVLTRRKSRLTDAAAAELEVRAELLGHWVSEAHVIDDTLRHEARFTKLRDAVDAARHRRAAWILSAALAVTTAAGLLSMTLFV